MPLLSAAPCASLVILEPHGILMERAGFEPVFFHTYLHSGENLTKKTYEIQCPVGFVQQKLVGSREPLSRSVLTCPIRRLYYVFSLNPPA